MKTYLCQSFLLMFGITKTHRQLNLYSVPIDSSDGLQKSNIKYFSRRKVRRNRIRDYPKENSLGLLSMFRPYNNTKRL